MQSVTRGKGFLELYLAQKRTNLINSLIEPAHRKGRILDIGCGTIPFFLINTDFKERYGIDPAATVINEYKGIRVINTSFIDVIKLQFPDSFFSVVSMLAVIEHINPNIVKKLLQDVFRILEVKGELLVTTPTKIGNFLLKIMSLFNIVSKEEIKDHKKIYNMNELKILFSDAGFKIKSFGRFQIFLNNWIVAQKK